MTVSVKINAQGFNALMATPSGPIARDMARRANRVVRRARQLVQVDEGKLKASIRFELRGSAKGPYARIGTNVKYARYAHDGTGIYAGNGYIYPKSGQYLRWPSKNNSGSGRRRYKGGKTAGYMFAKKVKGMKGTFYLSKALPAAG